MIPLADWGAENVLLSNVHMYRYPEDLESDTYNQPSTGEAQKEGLYVQGWPNVWTTSAI